MWSVHGTKRQDGNGFALVVKNGDAHPVIREFGRITQHLASQKGPVHHGLLVVLQGDLDGFRFALGQICDEVAENRHDKRVPRGFVVVEESEEFTTDKKGEPLSRRLPFKTDRADVYSWGWLRLLLL